MILKKNIMNVHTLKNNLKKAKLFLLNKGFISFRNITLNTFFIGITSYLLLDFILSGFLFVSAKKDQDKYYFQNYPLLLRSMIDKSVSMPEKEFKSTAVSEYDSFSLLGFFDPSLISIVEDNKKIASLDNINDFKNRLNSHVNDGGRIIVAVGGSTTAISQIGNWPTQIEKLLRDDNFLIINAGHNGFTSFQENILLFQILFPIINPILPDVVISLTGVNDISRGVSSVLLRDLNPTIDNLKPAIIPAAYIGNDIMNHRRSSTIAVIRNNILNSKFLRKFMPSFQAFVESSSEEIRTPQPLFEALGSKNKSNLMRLGNLYIAVPQSSGAFAIEDVLRKGNNLKGSIYKSYGDMVKSKNHLDLVESNRIINLWSEKRKKLFKNKPVYKLNLRDKNSVINQLLSNHNQTYNTLKSYGIDYFAFLQPISKGNYDGTLKDIPNYNYNLVHWYMRKDIKGHDSAFNGFEIFEDISQEIQKPPLSNYFYKIEFPNSKIMKKDPFKADNIHYYGFASYFIAEQILEKIYVEIQNKKGKINFLKNY